MSPVTFFLLCVSVSLQRLPATVRCVNYIWPGKSAAGSIFKPSRPPVCRLLWRSLSDFASFSWEGRVPGSSLRCLAVYFLPSTTQPSGPGLTSRALGSGRPCVCAGEGLSPAAVMVRLSGCQLQVCKMRWLFWLAKRCQQTWRAGYREDLPKRLPSCKAHISAQSPCSYPPWKRYRFVIFGS